MANKGSPFEREIAVALSLWWTKNERDDVFWRRDSGARAKRRTRDDKHTFGAHGDIVAADPVGVPLTNCCTIELKRGYKKWSFLDIIDQLPMKKGQKNRTLQPFEEFAHQVCEDAQDINTYPVIIARRDKRQSVIAIPNQLFEDISASYVLKKHETPLIVFKSPQLPKLAQEMVVIRFSAFCEWCSPDYFINRAAGAIHGTNSKTPKKKATRNTKSTRTS